MDSIQVGNEILKAHTSLFPYSERKSEQLAIIHFDDLFGRSPPWSVSNTFTGLLEGET